MQEERSAGRVATPDKGRDGDATRQRILAEVARRPGQSKNGLRARLGLNWRTIDHHLRRLTEAGLLVVRDGGWSHEIYPSGGSEATRAWLRYLNRAPAMAIIAHLASHPDLSTMGLSAALRKDRNAILDMVRQLHRDGIVLRRGRTRPTYRLNDPAPELRDHLRALESAPLHAGGRPQEEPWQTGLGRQSHSTSQQRDGPDTPQTRF